MEVSGILKPGSDENGIKKLLRSLSLAVTALCMCAAYFSAAALILTGVGYAGAYTRSAAISDYTGTPAFKEASLKTLDALYLAVTAEEAAPPELPSGSVWFAFSLAANRVLCSDGKISDVPGFEEGYLNGEGMRYVCRVSGGTFTVENRAAGTKTEYAFSESAALFGGETRRYDDCVLIFALPDVPMGFTGFRLAKWELFALKNGPLYAFVLAGVLMVSLAVLASGGARRRRIERFAASGVMWMYFEFKLAALAAAAWYTASASALMPLLARILLIDLPLLGLLGCNARYYPKTFFRQSLCRDVAAAVRGFYDSLLPVLPMQVKLKKRLSTLAIFGFAVPIALFFLTDLLIGADGLRLVLPFYIFYLAGAVYLFARHYVELCNGVSDLIRGSAMLPLGAAVPDFGFEEGDDLYPLARNLSESDKSAAAAADRMFLQTNKKLAELKTAAGELRDMISVLEITVKSSEDDPELAAQVRSIADRAENFTKILAAEAPLSPPVLKRCDLLTILDEVVNEHLPELSAARLSIRARLPQPPAYITADPSQIRAMLGIIFDNLAKYSLSGSRVELSVRLDSEQWIFEMTNTVNTAGSPADVKLMPSSTGLIRAREYVELNGGTFSREMSGEFFRVSFTLPAAH